MDFPTGFRWGVATAAYQIEGAVTEDGRGTSIWDTFSHTEGKVRDGQNGDTACDHYHRWPQDVALLAGLGVDDYRFSISWPRVRPDGGKAINPAGLDFYERLVDALLAAGITPTPTLYHWDLPQPLEDRGGWLNRDTAYRFAEFAYVVAERLADRVPLWFTMNEPSIVTGLGYATGYHAPGRTLGLAALPAAHHQLMAHGLAVSALRARGVRRIGIANNYTPVWPADGTALDAAHGYDLWRNRIFTDPVLRGSYPDLTPLGLPDTSFIRAEDLAVIATPVDLLGVNYYRPARIGVPEPGSALPWRALPITEYPATNMRTPIVPAGLTELLRGLHEQYWDVLPPIYITENGCSLDGRIDDTDRIAYHREHLAALREAMDAGVDVAGYYIWSLLDNFEWAEGFHQRFGLVHVDFDTQVRTPRSSYGWYRDLIAAQPGR